MIGTLEHIKTSHITGANQQTRAQLTIRNQAGGKQYEYWQQQVDHHYI